MRKSRIIQKSIVLVASSLVFAMFNSAPVKAETFATVTLVSPTFVNKTTIDSSFKIVFNVSGGVAAKSTDCSDVTGLDVRVGISDELGHFAIIFIGGDPVLWSGYRWKSKVIPNGLECSWDYFGSAASAISVGRGEMWVFGLPDDSSLPYLSDPYQATKLTLAWQSPITGLDWGRGGQKQTVANQQGSRTVAVGGTLAPEISFKGISRGDLISLPKIINVEAITDPNLPITEFNFGVNGGDTLWIRSPYNGDDQKWISRGTSNCSPVNSKQISTEKTLVTSQCTFVPQGFASNLPLAVAGYTSDHRKFLSETVFVSSQAMQKFEITSKQFVPLKDSKGLYSTANTSGVIKGLPQGVYFSLCVSGENPSNPKANTSNCQTLQVDAEGMFKATLPIPQTWRVSANLSLPKPYEFLVDAKIADWENSAYACQNSGGCLSKAQLASANKSRYSEGYDTIRKATLSSLRTLNFFGFFSPNHKLTKQNAVSWCNQVVNMLPFHGGWGPNAISTWVQGCTAAAIKIPYNK